MNESINEKKNAGKKSFVPLWSERQRLAYLERVLYWRGWVNRRDIMEKFGISVPQASNDMVTYLSMNPKACIYNTRRKRYEATPQFRTLIIEPSLEHDAGDLGLESPEAAPVVAYTEIPGRLPEEKIIRRLTRAVFAGEAVKAHYFSVNSGLEEDRWISPRAFAHDGLRWHCRAYCHLRKDFRDFVIGRITEISAEREDDALGVVDEDWRTFITLQIRPHDKLSASARRALELDYRMSEGKFYWRVRKALEIYCRRRLGFPDSGVGVANEKKQLFLEKINAEKM